VPRAGTANKFKSAGTFYSSVGTEEYGLGDLHGNLRAIERRIVELRNPPETSRYHTLPASIRREVVAYLERRRNSVKPPTVRKDAAWLPIIAEVLGADFLTPTRDTPDRFAAAFAKYTPDAKEGAWRVATHFWRERYRKARRELPGWLRLTIKRERMNGIGPGDLLTQDEVRRMVDRAQNLRDPALLLTLYETGRRPSEVLGLRLKDVERTRDGYFRIFVRGAKASPDVPVFVFEDGVPALGRWLQAHPYRGNPDAPLWVDTRRDDGPHAVGYRGFYKVVKTLARRAGVERKGRSVFPYLLRHTRITETRRDNQITQGVAERMFGWAIGTDAIRRYDHMASTDVEQALRAKHGFTDVTEKHRPSAAPKPCPRCHVECRADAEYCDRCGGPLDMGSVLALEERAESAKRLRAWLAKPRVADFLVRELARDFKTH
jgi:integrase/recombinase XerD